MDGTSRYIGTWWKRATAGNQLDIVPKIMERHDCTKVCGIILPSDHVAHHAVVKAKTGDHSFVSMVNLPIAGMRIVKLN